MTKYSALEHVLRSILYAGAGIVREDVGRLVVKKSRPDEYAQMIEDVLKLRGLRANFDFRSYKKTLVDLKNLRDAIAHGIFAQHPSTGTIGVRYYAGNWDVGSRNERWSFRLRPSRLCVDTRSFDELDDALRVAFDQALTLGQEVSTLCGTNVEVFYAEIFANAEAVDDEGAERTGSGATRNESVPDDLSNLKLARHMSIMERLRGWATKWTR